MTNFRVHYEIDGARKVWLVSANSPDDAAITCRKMWPGAIVRKVKRDKSNAVVVDYANHR